MSRLEELNKKPMSLWTEEDHTYYDGESARLQREQAAKFVDLETGEPKPLEDDTIRLIGHVWRRSTPHDRYGLEVPEESWVVGHDEDTLMFLYRDEETNKFVIYEQHFIDKEGNVVWRSWEYPTMWGSD